MKQHGSVYWAVGSSEKLWNMSNLSLDLENAFSVLESPIWMDSSTTAECRVLEETLKHWLKSPDPVVQRDLLQVK